MIRSVFAGLETHLFLPACAAFVHLHSPVISLWNQAAATGQKKLEQEVAAFLSMLKNDGLAESKTCVLIVN